MQKSNKKSVLTYYDSCFAHNCSVWDEKDVLDVDIKGAGCLASMKRFWYNLFLLSFTDLRVKHFYTSSHAVKVARAMHFRHYRSCIHPLSKFRNFWDFFILHVMVLNKIFFHMNSSMIHSPGIHIHYAALLCEVLIIFDVYLNFKTGYADKTARQIFMEPRYVLKRYMSTTLCMHVASSIPFEALMFLRYGRNIACSPCKCNMFVATLRFCSLVGTLRLFEMSSYWSRERSSYKIAALCRFIRTVVLGMVVMMQVLTFADGLNMLSLIVDGTSNRKSYVSVLLMYRYSGDMGDTTFLFFCLEFSRISKSFLLFGYDLQPNETTFDQLSALISFIVAYMFHMWIFLGMHNCLTRSTFSEDMYITNLDRTLNILRAHAISDDMNDKVRAYYKGKMSMLTLTEKQNGLYVALPKALKREIVLSSYRKHVLRLPFFAEWPYEIINEIALLLEQEVFLEKDTVGNAYSQSEGLIIVEAGLLAVYSVAKKETSHLIDGDYFGELSLVTDKEMRMSTIVALTYCCILFLSKKQFRMVMREHPQLFFDMKKKLSESYNRNVDQSEKSQSDGTAHK